MGDSSELKNRLNKLENDLKDLLKATEADLEVARLLQKELTPTQIPQIKGLNGSVRHHSAMEMNAEGFDLIPNADNKELWMIQYWASSFGLSSVLLQSLLKIKSNKVLTRKENPEVETVFDVLSDSLHEASKGAKFNLGVYRLKMKELHLSGCSVGLPPALIKEKGEDGSGVCRWGGFETLVSQAQNFQSHQAANAPRSLKAFRWDTKLKANSRFYLMGRMWCPDSSIEDFSKALGTSQFKEWSDEGVVDDMNFLALRMQDHMKAAETKADITLMGFAIDENVLFAT